MTDPTALKKIAIRGVVQGVGFRPFVYRLAHDHGLTGWVLNHSRGVEIEVEGPEEALAAFARDLETQAPPLARIEGIEIVDGAPAGHASFEIRHSVAEEGESAEAPPLLISPDIATCPDCLRELLAADDRRYRYPFTNCTNCGPRFTIIADIPYDRPLTTMRHFPMCAQCQAEYDDPLDRRFHAQPNACPVCGPHVWLEKNEGLEGEAEWAGVTLPAERDEALSEGTALLKRGAVLAIKGLGGFHLACDGSSEAAVYRLRQRKGRPAKPLAVMLATLEEVRQHCFVSQAEELLLTSPQRPIVLLGWKPESSIVPLVAPRNNYLGVMLPYTPLHHVLLRDVGRPLVMTSGNLSEEPIAQDNDEARRRLGHLADFFLMHNRDIYARYDDSVWFVPTIPGSGGQSELLQPDTPLPQPIRRSRGYAPFPVRLPFQMRQILACGAELKNTFCVSRSEYAFLSQHIGDLENVETLEHFETTVELYERLFRIQPEIIAYDMHPEYLATKYAKRVVSGVGEDAAGPSRITHHASRATHHASLIPVQHHHAHIASCLADNGWGADDGPVIGVAWDGTGYGSDGRIWGGEFLVAGYDSFRRAGHLEYLPLPGGDAAIRNPVRLAFGYLYALAGQVPLLPSLSDLSDQEQRIIRQQVDRGINCPQTSAGGRLFDAVSALLGVRARAGYEAQAAIELEMAAHGAAGSPRMPAYPFDIERVDGLEVIRLRRLLEAIITDIRRGTELATMAYRFHVTVAETIRAVCESIAEESGLRTVALSGGCFQNRLLLALVVPLLRDAGFRVLMHQQVPCNDGGISLGQAVIANANAA